MTGSTHDPPDPSAVARICYASAFVYAAFVVFCGCQVSTRASVWGVFRGGALGLMRHCV